MRTSSARGFDPAIDGADRLQQSATVAALDPADKRACRIIVRGMQIVKNIANFCIPVDVSRREVPFPNANIARAQRLAQPLFPSSIRCTLMDGLSWLLNCNDMPAVWSAVSPDCRLAGVKLLAFGSSKMFRVNHVAPANDATANNEESVTNVIQLRSACSSTAFSGILAATFQPNCEVSATACTKDVRFGSLGLAAASGLARVLASI